MKIPAPRLALLLSLAMTVLSCLPVHSQSSRPLIYEIELGDGGYLVDLNHVTSISVHRFFVDGALMVDELTVDSLGNTVARFYVADRNREVETPRGVGQSLLDKAQEKVDQARDRIGATNWMDRAVVKSYPTSTHAHTVEYRISSKEQLMELYAHISDAWKKGQSGKFKIE
jgi:hypothetical protein